MLVTEWVEPLREEIGWLGDELGAVRDLDVLRQHLGEEIDALEPTDARGGALLIRALELEREGQRDRLLTALRSERYFRLLGTLEDAARKPEIADPDVSLEVLARDAFKRPRRAVHGLGDEPSDEALHEVRIKAKRARYAAELVAPALGKPAPDTLQSAVQLSRARSSADRVLASEARGRWFDPSRARQANQGLTSKDDVGLLVSFGGAAGGALASSRRRTADPGDRQRCWLPERVVTIARRAA